MRKAGDPCMCPRHNQPSTWQWVKYTAYRCTVCKCIHATQVVQCGRMRNGKRCRGVVMPFERKRLECLCPKCR
jgi:hypothetical protein